MSNCRTRTKIRKPSKAQKEAYRKLVTRNGEKNLTNEERQLLATCQWLTVSQREAIAASVNW